MPADRAPEQQEELERRHHPACNDVTRAFHSLWVALARLLGQNITLVLWAWFSEENAVNVSERPERPVNLSNLLLTDPEARDTARAIIREHLDALRDTIGDDVAVWATVIDFEGNVVREGDDIDANDTEDDDAVNND